MQSELTSQPAPGQPGEATPGSRPTAKRGRTLLIVSAAAVGAAIGGAGIASAATTGASSTTAASSAASSGTPAADPATLSHGPGETLLTGTAAAKVTAAAQKEVPGGTIIRVETDSGGAAYEAHIRKADGTYVTVKFDKTTQNGATTLHFQDLTMTRADMTVGVQGLSLGDIQCIAAHEFGHALGIDGHSPQQGDLMYAIHFIGDTCPITQRDLDTMKTGYCHLFGKSAQIRRRMPSPGPERTVTIQ